jgi:probable HAF family extracellular repeat protein
MPIYTYTTLDDPSATAGTTQASGINDTGQIVGSYVSSGDHGFLYSGGTYTAIDDPLALLAEATQAFGINATGQIVGTFFNTSGGGYHGFLYSGGTYTTLDVPGGSSDTFAYGINASGQIVGNYTDGSNHLHGFLYSGGIYTTLDGPFSRELVALKCSVIFASNPFALKKSAPRPRERARTFRGAGTARSARRARPLKRTALLAKPVNGINAPQRPNGSLSLGQPHPLLLSFRMVVLPRTHWNNLTGKDLVQQSR